MKPQPLRMCVVTKERLPKEALLRFVVRDERLLLDPSFSAPGRGVYVKNDPDVLARFSSEKFRRKAHLPPCDLSSEEDKEERNGQ